MRSNARPRSAIWTSVERQGKTDRDIRRDLRRALKPEFVNRVRLIDFNRLTGTSAERILDLELERIARRYREIHGLNIVLDASVAALDAVLERLVGEPHLGLEELGVELDRATGRA